MNTEKCLDIVERTIDSSYASGEGIMLEKCINKADEMIGSPTEDDLRKFLHWLLRQRDKI